MQKDRSFKNIYLFFRLLIPYLIIFLIPIIVWGVLTYHNIKYLILKSEMTIYNDLNFAQDMASQRLDDLKNIAYRISKEPSLQPSFIKLTLADFQFKKR